MYINFFIPYLFPLLIISIVIGPILFNKWHKYANKYYLIIGIVSFLCNFHSYIFIIKELIPFISILIGLIIFISKLDFKWNVGGIIGDLLLISLGIIICPLIGTTGATLLISSNLFNNKDDNNIYVTVKGLLCIFLVSNCFGALSFLGDPPLLMGFLRGIHPIFFTQYLWKPVIILTIPLYIIFILIGYYLGIKMYYKNNNNSTYSIKYKNIKYIIITIISFISSNIYLTKYLINTCHIYNHFIFPLFIIQLYNFSLNKWNKDMYIYGVFLIILLINIQLITMICGSICIIYHSFLLKKLYKNHIQDHVYFSLIEEITCLFIGLLLSLHNFELKFVHVINTFILNINNDKLYFYVIALMSGFLDNTPTFLLFFKNNMVVKRLIYLCLGTVFGGALTPIGNAPNIIVIHEMKIKNYKFLNFITYTAISCAILLPMFFLVLSLI